MEMMKTEQETMDMSKVMMQSLESSSLGNDYLSSVTLPTGSHSPSPSTASLPQSMSDLLGGFVNPSSIIANNMDSSVVSSILEQMATIQSQFLTSQSLPFLTNPPIPTPSTPSKETYCEVCDKLFSNKFFLRTHRLKMHGIDDGGSPLKMVEDSSSPMEEGGRNSSVIRERASVEGTSTDRREIKEEEKNGWMETDGMTSMCKCDECSFETESIFTLIQHKSVVHPKMESDLTLAPTKNETVDNANTVTPPSVSSSSSFPCPDCDSAFDSHLSLAQHSIVHGNIGNLLNMLGGGEASSFPAFLLNSQLPNPFSSLGNTSPVVKPPTAKRNYSSAGKNYCDVCNKEVCNKYFLRTHMLKMHGIVIDENKPVIANIDTRERERTGELTFRCDLCSTTLTSRQQLREHKQSAHGVSYPVGNPSTPTQSTPTRPQKNNNVVPSGSSLVPPIPSSLSSIDLSSLNGESIPSSESMAMAMIAETLNAPSMSLPTPKDLTLPPLQGLAKCQHCVYTTRYARNMEYHVERHERLNDMGGSGMRGEGREEKKDEEGRRNREEEILRMTTQAALHMAKATETPSSVQCSKCHRTFSSPAVLQSHTHLFHSHKMSKAIAHIIAQKRRLNSKMPLKHPKIMKNVLKRKLTAEKENDVHASERHSVTSGSISPLRGDIPEGVSSCDCGYSLQSVLVSTPLGLPLPSQFTAHLPLSSPLLSPLTLTLTLTPTPLISLP